MGYIIKDTITDLTNKEEQLVYYSGKDGYVWDYKEYVEPYATEKGAFKKIQREIDCWINRITRINDTESIEAGRWHHKYEIIKVGA